MSETKLKLFVWPHYARDLSEGLAFGIAKDSDAARDMIEERAGYRDISLAESPEVHELDESIAFESAGGG